MKATSHYEKFMIVCDNVPLHAASLQLETRGVDRRGRVPMLVLFSTEAGAEHFAKTSHFPPGYLVMQFCDDHWQLCRQNGISYLSCIIDPQPMPLRYKGSPAVKGKQSIAELSRSMEAARTEA